MRYLSTNFRTSRPVVRAGLGAATALLLLSGRGYAATPTNASLNGAYVFHTSTVKEEYWNATKSCHYTNITYTYGGGGQSANTEIINGEATFDGKGHVSIDYTDIHRFNPAASNETVSITCPSKPGGSVNTNNGHLVDDSPASGSLTGTYVVNSDGSATITLADDQGELDLNLAAFNTAGLSTTFLIIIPDSPDANGTGIGVHK